MTKVCSKCDKIKELSEFNKNNQQKDGYYGYCKACYGKRRKIYRKNTKVAHRGMIQGITYKFKMTEASLQDMMHKQQGCCAICGVDFGSKLTNHNGRQYAIDHSHDTGKVRGLLCMACNMYVGAMEAQKSGPDIVLEYIKRGL